MPTTLPCIVCENEYEMQKKMRRYIQYVYINYYRIPRVIFHEKMDFNTAAEGLGESGGRAIMGNDLQNS